MKARKAAPTTTRDGLTALRSRAGPNLRPRIELDHHDVHLIELVTRDGRMSNRALAREVSLSEATVASRIRSLFDNRLLGVTATLDWVAAGYEWDAWFEIDVGGRPLRVVGGELAALDNVHAVHMVFGPVDLFVHVLLPSADLAVEFIHDRMKSIVGVRGVRTNVALETVKYTTQFVRLPVQSRAPLFPAPIVDLDELDSALIQALVVDGRQSNRQIARQLSVSEGTVRVRLRRLESAGLLQIRGQSDPFLTGRVGAWAFVGIDVENGAGRKVAQRLCAMPEAAIVALTAGRHDVMGMITASSRTRLTELVVEEIRQLPGVRATETWEGVQTLGQNYQWARLL